MIYFNDPEKSNYWISILQLHLAALTSLKGEIIELNNRLHHVTSERDVLEKQVNRLQVLTNEANFWGL